MHVIFPNLHKVHPRGTWGKGKVVISCRHSSTILHITQTATGDSKARGTGAYSGSCMDPVYIKKFGGGRLPWPGYGGWGWAADCGPLCYQLQQCPMSMHVCTMCTASPPVTGGWRQPQVVAESGSCRMLLLVPVFPSTRMGYTDLTDLLPFTICMLVTD